jgi:predicted  nucleic acid-binding Zn-ribbon protein
MAVFKCKMCGGDLNITEADKVVECEYCGTTQTVPSADNEKKMTLFNRANRLRLNNEFDKAAALYEQLIAEFPEEAEAYWGLCLCNWGIEYVDDPATGEKKPTCHRASFESLMKDENYLLAMEYADITAQRVYRREAQEIDRLNDAILSVSRNEKPYDVFICYKETDENGMRTHDSVLAQDVYDALTAKGLKVFFSRITLEDKLGRQYEPYIFAALNSAKVMLAIGTKYEYFQAVWVKNEWSRFMRLAAKDRSKVLIPCFRDMDPYDLPDEFKGLQAQDLGKLGAVQDLVRGVGKLLAKDAPKDGDVQQAAVSNPAATTVQSLLKRAFMFLEDGEWGSANEYAEKVLDIDPEDGEAYLAKAMSDLKKRSRSSMNDASGIALNANIQKALRFGSGSLKNEINDYIESTKAAEAADQLEADKVIAAFSARQSGRQAQPLVQQLAAAKQRASYIEKICGGYDKTAAQIKQLNGEKTAANSRLNTLRSKRDSLGLFAVKERKRLDGEISEIAAGLKQLELKLDSALKQLGGFESKAAADKALSTARADVSSLQNRINESALTGSGEFSCSQALKVLLAKPRVFQLVSKKQPRLASSYKGFVTIAFGRYPQASNNESALIEWLVLKNDGSKALLISKYALDCQRYNTSGRDVTWETCTLRRWLNGSFINSAFSAEEQKQILHTTVTADRNPSSNTDPGNNTTDKVFLLSRAECSQYLVLCDARSCEGTAYCFAQGAAQQDVYGGCRWWLRSPADYSGCVICVNDNGTYASAGCSTFSDGITVRPALWINLGS